MSFVQQLGGTQVKNIILSALVAISTLSAVSSISVAPVQAASLTITTDNGDMGRHHWRRHHNRHCFVKVKKVWRHHHWVIKKVRICEWRRY